MQAQSTFKCGMCGLCCANQELIQLTTYEMYRLANGLGMSAGDFFQKYCELGETNLTPSMHLYLKTQDLKCPFLKDNKCSVHQFRPYACRAYPVRAYKVKASDMKEFVRTKYPMMEPQCKLFDIPDEASLDGDVELLTDQVISYWSDEAYFNIVWRGGQVDLSIPFEVSEYYIQRKDIRDAAEAFIKTPDHPPSGLDAERAFARLTMSLQALTWKTCPSFVRDPSKISMEEDPRLGRYLLLRTNTDSVTALRAMVDSGAMDLARTFYINSKSFPDRYIIASTYGTTLSKVTLGFMFDIDRISLDTITEAGIKPLTVFFLPEDGTSSSAVGFTMKTAEQ